MTTPVRGKSEISLRQASAVTLDSILPFESHGIQPSADSKMEKPKPHQRPLPHSMNHVGLIATQDTLNRSVMNHARTTRYNYDSQTDNLNSRSSTSLTEMIGKDNES